MKSALDKVFVALDNMDKEEIFNFLNRTNGKLKNIKIGLELFNKYGPTVVQELYEKYEVNIFLDLKLHDIPNTVSKSIMSLQGLPIKFLTIHLSGGKEMIQQALEARDKAIPDCKILGVSILTSLDEQDLIEIWGIRSIQDTLVGLFNLANNTKIDGIICSPKDLPVLNSMNHSLLAVTPGIRFADEINSSNQGDQKRVLTPSQAFQNKANFLVMGRSLTQADDINLRLKFLEKMN